MSNYKTQKLETNQDPWWSHTLNMMQKLTCTQDKSSWFMNMLTSRSCRILHWSIHSHNSELLITQPWGRQWGGTETHAEGERWHCYHHVLGSSVISCSLIHTRLCVFNDQTLSIGSNLTYAHTACQATTINLCCYLFLVWMWKRESWEQRATTDGLFESHMMHRQIRRGRAVL